MKRLIAFVLFALFISCSSDSSSTEEENEISTEELLVNGSPWTFSEYLIDEVLNTNGFDLMESDINNQIQRENESNNGLTLEFNSDGTGTTNQAEDFQWELIPDDSIRLTFTPTEISEAQLSVSESEMILGFPDEFEVPVSDGTVRGIEINASLVFN
ncbi:MAG: hypothetical protein AAFZ89_12320 [Bacteroidota bacterium]